MSRGAICVIGLLMLAACSTEQQSSAPSSKSTPPATAQSQSTAGAQVTASGADVSESDLQAASRFIALARHFDSQAVDSMSLADAVDLSLGQRQFVRTLSDGKSDMKNWLVSVPTSFRGSAAGSLSAPEQLLSYLRSDPKAAISVSEGPHPRCVGPKVPPAAQDSAYRQVSLQPTSNTIDSCLDWFAIDLFVDESGHVRTVDLDLYEP